MNVFSILKNQSVRTSVMSYLVLTAALGIACVSLTGKTYMTYQQSQETKQKIVSMQNEIQSWQDKANFLNKQPYRPVAKTDVQSVQSDLLTAMQAHNLTIDNFRMVQATKKEPHGNFELTFHGSYPDTMALLGNFHSKDALINIMNMKMESKNGSIETTLRYKIYVNGK